MRKSHHPMRINSSHRINHWIKKSSYYKQIVKLYWIKTNPKLTLWNNQKLNNLNQIINKIVPNLKFKKHIKIINNSILKDTKSNF